MSAFSHWNVVIRYNAFIVFIDKRSDNTFRLLPVFIVGAD